MPSFKMKTNLNMSSIRETNCLSVCQKSNVISKKSYSHVSVSQQPAEFDKCVQKCQDGYVASSMEIYTQEGDIKNNEAVDLQDLPRDGNSQFLKQLPISVDSGTTGDIESIYNFASNLETIFSPVLEPIEVLSVPNIDDGAGNNNDLYVPGLGPDDSDYNRSSCDYQTCNISDFFISDMIIASLPFGESAVVNDFTDANPFLDYKCAEPSMLFDVAEECMILPFLKDTAKVSDSNDMKSSEEAMIDSDNSGLYLAINQIRSCDQESDLITDSDQAEDFDPQFFIRNLPELSDVVSNFRPSISPKEPCRRKSITLVLDLDETLVHSTLEHCDDADFTFTVFFNMKEHTVYVKQRPHVHTFLERVAEMFEVVIFTASQSIYAAQLLDMLDPDRKLISQRIYRESCIFSDGSYTKDLTVLGVDLAKVAIIDNSPQVFRLQVNNGIPIKSWFSDSSDCALISLLPFLETLVDADDVRPIIAKRFGHLRNILDYLLMESIEGMLIPWSQAKLRYTWQWKPAIDYTAVSQLLTSSLDCCKAKARPLASISNLSTRLKLDEESPDCWNSLLQLQACAGEIVLFFLSGEAQLGRICCQALSTIGEHCWPSMIDTLGFNTEESQILEGYCDKAVDSTAPSPPAAPSVVPF